MASIDKTNISERLKKYDSTGRKYAGKSRAYSQYFEGYTEYLKYDKKGRSRIVREYTADWYTPDEPASRRRIRKLAYLLAAAAAFALYVYLSIQPFAYNYSYEISIIQIVATLVGAWSILAMLRFAGLKTKMTIYDYKKSTSWVRRSSLLSSICYLLLSISTLICAIIARDMRISRVVLTVGGYILAGLLVFAIYKSEKNAAYTTIPNETEPAPDGYTIEN